MAIYPIPDTLESIYHGTDRALAAIKDGQLIDFIYMTDVLKDCDDPDTDQHITDARLAPTIDHLRSIGELSIGMVSCWEFTEL